MFKVLVRLPGNKSAKFPYRHVKDFVTLKEAKEAAIRMYKNGGNFLDVFIEMPQGTMFRALSS